jgi:uncharacterized membrane protein
VNQKLNKLIIIVIGLLVTLPTIFALNHQGFPDAHDDYLHFGRLHDLHQALIDGHMPPRWAKDFGFGYGMPMFHFYGPLFYYLAEIFYALGLSAAISLKITIYLNMLGGFYFTYLLIKEFFGKTGAYLASLFFVYAPYRASQVYVRASFAELMATTFLPLAFYSVYKYLENKKRKYFILSIISIASVFYSHNIIAMFFMPFLCLWVLVWLIYFNRTKPSFFKSGFQFTAIVCLSTALAASYLLPAFLEKKYTKVEEVRNGYFHYIYHFVYPSQFFDNTFGYGSSNSGIEDDGMSFQLGRTHIALASISLLCFLIFLFAKTKFPKSKQLVLYLATFLSFAISIFLMLPQSEWVWKNIGIIQFAQFPWRLLSFALFYLSIIVGFLGYLIEKISLKILKIFLITIITFTVILANYNFFKADQYCEELTDINNEIIQTFITAFQKDYLPIWINKVPDHGLDRISYVKGEGSIKIITEKTGKLTFTAQTNAYSDIKIGTYYFPGWEIYIDGTLTQPQIDPVNGFMIISLDPGRHYIQVLLTKTTIQKTSDLLSLLIFISILLVILADAANFVSGNKIKVKINKKQVLKSHP